MQTLHNATTGKSVDWNGTLDEFYAASGADQAGQWAAELVLEIAPAEPVPVVEAPVEGAV